MGYTKELLLFRHAKSSRDDPDLDDFDRPLAERGEGINVLTGADAAAPYGGAAFHDNRVWLRPAA